MVMAKLPLNSQILQTPALEMTQRPEKKTAYRG